MTDGDHLIWTNYDLNYEDWREFLEEEYPELSDDERFRVMLELNADFLQDERVNLNLSMSQPILVIADLGLWNGRFSGYKEILSGNIRDCLRPQYDYSTFYVDRLGDLRSDEVHHDGTNHYLFRAYKDGTTETQREHLKDKIYAGTATRSDITRITSRLGDAIGRVYGWSFPNKERKKEEMER